MRRIQCASVSTRSRPFYLLGVTSLGLVLAATACGSSDNNPEKNGAAGNGGIPAQGGSAGTAGSSGSSSSAGRSNSAGGTASLAGSPGTDAGSGGDTDAAGASSAEAGAAGAATELVACQPGGTLFVVGNYVNTAGDEIFLRSTASAATIALVPKAPATPAKPPQLFAVERFCASGDAFLARDESSQYRVDFSQSGSQFSLCISSAVATLDAASSLIPANLAHATDTGCAGKPFSVYTAEAL